MELNVICATRFKHYDTDGAMLPVRCKRCSKRGAQEIDSLEHLLVCVGLDGRLKTLDDKSREEKVDFLRELMFRAKGEGQCTPAPLYPQLESELVLDWSVSSAEEISL